MERNTNESKESIKEIPNVRKEDLDRALADQRDSFEEVRYGVPPDTNTVQRRMHHKRKFRK